MKPSAFLFGLALAAGAHVARADEVDVLRKDLRSADLGRAVEAAQKLGEDTSSRAMDLLLDELAIGAPPEVQAALLGGLEGRKDPRALDVLVLYARNHNPKLRKKAVVAASSVADARAVSLLIAALSDGVPEVRGAAARALAARKERSAADALVKLLQHQDTAAVDALAAVAGPEVARQLAELIGQIPDALLVDTLGELLKRPDFGPDPIRVELVQTLGKLSGADATAALKDYLTATDKDKTRPSRVAAQKLLEQRGAN